MRLILIPGLGEDEYIFDKIKDHLPGEKDFLSLWKLLPDTHVSKLNISRFAKELADHYNITKDDVVIGHSTGAWAAAHIKNSTQCHAIQIAGWTDPKKVVTPISNRHLLYFIVKAGLYLNRFTLGWSLRAYRNNPSRDLFLRIFNRMREGSKANVTNQLRLIFNPVTLPLTTPPDLRIHSKGDVVVRCPDEPYIEVPGDHFALYTHPEAVYKPIAAYLAKLR